MSSPVTGEPKHDDDGKERPGSQPLTSVVNPETVASADAIWAEHNKNSQMRNNFSGQNPNITDPYSPLESLITDAFQRFGNMSADTLDGGIKAIMLRYANRIVEDIRIHPYTATPDLDYYRHLQDTRPIPDEIMISGLAYHYSKWMKSAASAVFFGEYTTSLNQILYQRKYGSGKIQMNTVDKNPEVK